MPNRLDITVLQGETFARDLWFTHRVFQSFSGYTARAQVRTTFTSSTKIVDFATVTTPIAIDTSAHKIEMLLSATETAAITAGRYVWDLELVSGSGVVTRLYSGSFVVLPEVTR